MSRKTIAGPSKATNDAKQNTETPKDGSSPEPSNGSSTPPTVLGTMTLSVSARVAELGQQQLRVAEVGKLVAAAGLPSGTTLGRKAGTHSLRVDVRSEGGKALSLLIADSHAIWIPHQTAGENRDALTALWKQLAKTEGQGKVTLEVVAVQSQANGATSLTEVAW